MDSSQNGEPTFVSMSEASRARGVSWSVIARGVVLGTVRTRMLPGHPPQYCLEDVKRLELVKPMPPRKKAQPIGV